MLMKVLFKIMAIALFTTGLSFYPTILRGNSLPTISVKSVKQQDKTIPIVLPFKAEVLLNNTTSSLSGRLINVDSTQQKITLALSGQSKDYSVTEIEKIEFKGKLKLIHSGKIVVRGNNSSNFSNNQETWTESLADFKITNPEDGQAEITLNSVSKLKLKGIRAVAKNNSYVVDEIIIDASGQKITIKVTPYSE